MLSNQVEEKYAFLFVNEYRPSVFCFHSDESEKDEPEKDVGTVLFFSSPDRYAMLCMLHSLIMNCIGRRDVHSELEKRPN